MLNRKKKYLQIALNTNPEEAIDIISKLPKSDRILIEAGTPLIKGYGITGIRAIKEAWQFKKAPGILEDVYIVADTKCMDRGKTEVEIARIGGAGAATVLGAAPIETINYFIDSCEEAGLDSMVDMIGVTQPIQVLRKLRKMPTVVVLHRGADEENFDKHKPVPYIQINKVRSSFQTGLLSEFP